MGLGRIYKKELFVLMVLLLVIVNIDTISANSIITTPISDNRYRSLPHPSSEINFVVEKDDQYLIREDNVFVPESTIKIKINTPITDNRYRLVAMDYVMVIMDPYENIIFIDIIKDRSRSYISESSATFSEQIHSSWPEGEYLIELYSYDRLDTAKLKNVDFDIYEEDESIDDLSEFFDEDPRDTILEDFEVLKSRSFSTVVKDTLNFIVDKNSNPVKVQNLSVNQNIIPINSMVLVTAQVENTIPEQTNAIYQLFLNDRPIKSFDSVMGSREWQTFNYEIMNAPVGENQIRLGNKRVNFTVSDTPLGPTQLVYLDLFSNISQLYAGYPFNISVTVLNIGSKGNVPVVLYVNNQEIIQYVDLDYGEKKTINYLVLISEPGTYSARIIGTEISKVLFIREIPEENGEDENVDKSSIFTFSIAFYAILFVLILMGVLRKYHRSRHPLEK